MTLSYGRTLSRGPQTADSARAIPACAECCRWLGGATDALQAVVRWADAQRRQAAAVLRPPPRAAVLCGDGCGAAYCSEACRGNAWAAHHRLLCTGCGAAGAPMRATGNVIFMPPPPPHTHTQTPTPTPTHTPASPCLFYMETRE
jgi:hypothetical protein